jgi:hypothetical protein
MQKTKTGKQQFRSGILKFAWAELKTMNFVKIKGLYLIGIGYIKMKYFSPKPKQIEHRQPRIVH